MSVLNRFGSISLLIFLSLSSFAAQAQRKAPAKVVAKAKVTAHSATPAKVAGQAKEGPGGTGGGDGFVGNFTSTVSQITDWLADNGKNLNPPIKAYDFATNADDTNKIVSVGPDSPVYHNGKLIPYPLYYKGNPRDMIYDGDLDIYILDRVRLKDVESNSPAMWNNVAHEIFRRMGKETDDYEISKQIIRKRFQPKIDLTPLAGDFYSTYETTQVSGQRKNDWVSGSPCYRHIEVDNDYQVLYVEVRSTYPYEGPNPDGCLREGQVFKYQCQGDTQPQCKQIGPFISGCGGGDRPELIGSAYGETIDIVPDGNRDNFVVHEFGVGEVQCSRMNPFAGPEISTFKFYPYVK